MPNFRFHHRRTPIHKTSKNLQHLFCSFFTPYVVESVRDFLSVRGFHPSRNILEGTHEELFKDTVLFQSTSTSVAKLVRYNSCTLCSCTNYIWVKAYSSNKTTNFIVSAWASSKILLRRRSWDRAVSSRWDKQERSRRWPQTDSSIKTLIGCSANFFPELRLVLLAAACVYQCELTAVIQ